MLLKVSRDCLKSTDLKSQTKDRTVASKKPSDKVKQNKQKITHCNLNFWVFVACLKNPAFIYHFFLLHSCTFFHPKKKSDSSVNKIRYAPPFRVPPVLLHWSSWTFWCTGSWSPRCSHQEREIKGKWSGVSPQWLYLVRDVYRWPVPRGFTLILCCLASVHFGCCVSSGSFFVSGSASSHVCVTTWTLPPEYLNIKGSSLRIALWPFLMNLTHFKNETLLSTMAFDVPDLHPSFIHWCFFASKTIVPESCRMNFTKEKSNKTQISFSVPDQRSTLQAGATRFSLHSGEDFSVWGG